MWYPPKPTRARWIPYPGEGVLGDVGGVNMVPYTFGLGIYFILYQP